MPDRRTHRGPDPHDVALFADRALPALRDAAADLVWLLNRGYAVVSSLKVVGDRYALRARQRAALLRVVCSDDALLRRRDRVVSPGHLEGRALRIDGFNVLTTVEAALGGALVLRGRDGCYRDLVGAHGNYRRVAETVPAAVAVGETLDALGIAACEWLFDAPVSNSGRLKTILGELGRERGWPWSVRLLANPDRELRRSEECVATADGAILESGAPWLNLARVVVTTRVPEAWVVGLFDDVTA